MSDQNEEEQKEDSLPLKVRDVMVREVITMDENSTVKEAVDNMNEFQIGSLIVLEKGKARHSHRKGFLEKGYCRSKGRYEYKSEGDNDHAASCC